MFHLFKKKRIIMTLLVRNEADIIEENLYIHHTMGIDGFIVTDNGSIDGTRKILDKYKRLGWILEIIDEPSHTHSQVQWVDRMIKLARDKYNADWIVNADADEFWIPNTHDFHSALKRYNLFSKLFVPIFNMIDNGGMWYNNSQRVVRELPQNMQQALVAEHKLSQYSQFSRQVPKVIVRANCYGLITMGNHNATLIKHKKRYKNSKNIKIYHFNSRGPAQFWNKIQMQGQAFERNTELSKDCGVHIRYWYNGLKDGSLDFDTEYKRVIGALCLNEIYRNAEIQQDDTVKKLVSKMPMASVYETNKLVQIEKQFPKILSFQEMLQLILNGASLARFGDAEFDIAFRSQNKNDPYQRPNRELSQKLANILASPTTDKLVIAIPELNAQHNNISNFYKNLSFWQWYWLDRWDNLSQYITQKIYGNSFFSRDAVFYALTLEQLKQIWDGRHVCFIVPQNGRFIYDDRIFGAIKSKTEITVPPTNAFDVYDDIFRQALKQPSETLFFIAAGPTATVLAADLSAHGFQALDMGHFTNCYRQYLGEAERPEAYPMENKEKK